MPVFRVTTGYGQANMGWSETWWTANNDAPALLTTINKQMALRKAMLWDYDYFVGLRIAEEGARRKSQFFPAGTRWWDAGGGNLLIPANGSRTGTALATRADQVRAALQLRVSYGSGRQTLRYLVGVPDSISATEPATDDLTGDPAWIAAYTAWRDAIRDDDWQIKARTPSPTSPERLIRSIGLQTAEPGLIGVGVLTGETLSVQPGDRVHIRGQNRKPSSADRRTMNGVWVIDSINSTLISGQVIYYLRNSEGIDPTQFRYLGTVQKVEYSYQDITSIHVHRVGIHKRGRPFGSPRGRRLMRRTLDP